ncbi:hypothetical protein Clacol_008705 [Clathrus columnatus]|uniref:Uncharacterized protein n=1 Tax=Clathrus columnatus TaxID=1419009 RepID=A0AAV5ANH0_9AGAM|nr:hypothetical protein Clacol_008705 [Clathrus columnatus]
MEHGYVVIKGAFTPEAAKEWTKDVWIRLGVDSEDRRQWNTISDNLDRIHMPRHNTMSSKEFAPKAWGAICELLGEDRIEPKTQLWNDAFIVNLGRDEYKDLDIHPRDLENWHVDGDFFVHFLDSPEQALLVIPLFSDIKHRGGATYISPEGLDHVAKYLAAHPEGCYPTGLSFTPSTGLDDPTQKYSLLELANKKLTNFVELTGDVGDVILLHPLMLHSASKNYIRSHRIITNPPIALKSDRPFNFARDDPNEYSLVELKTLKALGVDRFEFKPTGERKLIVPKRVERQTILYDQEKTRLEAHYGNMNGVQRAPLASRA